MTTAGRGGSSRKRRGRRGATPRKRTTTSIRVKRAYQPAAASDGRRVLVERLWPRGVTKARLRLDDWAKDAAPSPELRRWFGHDPERWPEFRRRYAAELRANTAAWGPLLAAARRGRITFIYAAHDVAHNGAIVLKAFLDRRR